MRVITLIFFCTPSLFNHILMGYNTTNDINSHEQSEKLRIVKFCTKI